MHFPALRQVPILINMESNARADVGQNKEWTAANIEGRIGITGGEVFLVISFGLGLQILSNVTTMQHYI